MSDLDIRVDSKNTQDFLAQLPQSMREKGLRSGLHAVGVELQTQIKQELSGRTLQRRTGRYYNSVKVTAVKFDGDGAHISVESDFIGARTHEEGLTIYPRKRKFLAVPFPSTPIGLTVPAALRQGAFIHGGIVYSKRATVPLFSFKQSIKIPKRPIWSVVSKRSQEVARYLVEVALDRVIREWSSIK